jgi:excisionase family DNA binding protein
LDELMNIKEAAGYLRLNSMTVYRLAQKKQIPAFKVGGNWRFKKELLEKWTTQKSTVNGGAILVVDDDPMIRELLTDILEKQSCRVVGVASGEEALREIARQHFDLVFLDLVLPGLKGTDTLKTLKEKDKDTVVVIITGYADEPIALEAMAMGPLLLIRKPFRDKDILETLSMVMKRTTI